MSSEKKNPLKEWQESISDVRQAVREFLSEVGVSYGQIAVYWSFMQKVLGEIRKYPNKHVTDKIKTATAEYWHTIYGVDLNILNAVADLAIDIKINGKDPDDAVREAIDRYYQSLGEKDDSL